ncbi:hypothetical protein SLS62_005212 [Diatrype stigma]|uniref:Clr5 domain-containing protein n=1 Tax=Diatrype stigma TaxID=117547 RepID=A0AAN9YT28_9PEZI
MNNHADLRSAGLNSGQIENLRTEPRPISDGYGPDLAPSQIEYDTGISVKYEYERRGSSASVGPEDVTVRHNPSMTGWNPISPQQSDASGIGETTSVSPLPSQRPGSVVVPVPKPSIENRGRQQHQDQQHGQHAGPKARQRAGAGRSAGPSSARPGKGGRSATRFHHHPQVWESHKAEIEEIYMKQNKSLKQLMDIMKDKNGFKATPRMYKSKFEQWGFAKNNKSKDVAMMLRLQRERDAAGKHTAFQRHGKMVDIHTYMRRKGISSGDLVVQSGDISADLPEYLRCLTPPPAEPQPQHMTLPDHLHAQEILVSCFRDLTLGWRDSIVSLEAFEADFNAYFDAELCEATRDFSRACWFFSRGYTAHGALLSQRAFSTLHLLITKPSALGMFDLLIASVIEPDYGLSRELWKYLAAYSKAKLGATSTFHRLFKALEDVFQHHALGAGVDFVFACMESIIGMLLEHRDLTRTIAPAISLFLLGDLVLFNSSRRDLPSLQRAIAASQDLVIADSAEGGREPDLSPTLTVARLLEPAAYIWQYGPHEDVSFQLAQAALHRHQGSATSRLDWSYWVAWRVIAEYHHGRCYVPPAPPVAVAAAVGVDNATMITTAAAAPVSSPLTALNSNTNPRHALARYSLERAIDAAEAARGLNEVQVFENLQKLEDWHREAGDAAQEVAVRRRKEGVLRAYLDILRKDHDRIILEQQQQQPGTPSSQ